MRPSSFYGTPLASYIIKAPWFIRIRTFFSYIGWHIQDILIKSYIIERNCCYVIEQSVNLLTYRKQAAKRCNCSSYCTWCYIGHGQLEPSSPDAKAGYTFYSENHSSMIPQSFNCKMHVPTVSHKLPTNSSLCIGCTHYFVRVLYNRWRCSYCVPR